MTKEEFISYCDKLNIKISEEIYRKFFTYFEMLVEWNNKFNMTSILEEKDVFLLHFYDSLCLFKVVNLNSEVSLCDFGTGAGFPGLPIAIVFPKVSVILVESNGKKCTFLNAVKDALNLKNVTVINDRIENYSSKEREKFDIVTCRAVTSIPMIFEMATPIVKVNGILAPLKSNCEEELVKYSYLEQELGIKLIQKEVYSLPINDAYRVIPVYKKEKVTDKKYPRSYNSLLKIYKNK